MKVGVWFYGVGTVLAGILNIAWGAFDAPHQPIKFLVKDPSYQHILAYVAGVWLVAAGLAILWKPSARIGAAASAIAYLIFAALWLPRYAIGVHTFGWRIPVLVGVSFGLAQKIMLVSPAVIVYVSTGSSDLLQTRAATVARWMLGLPPVVFGLFHLTSTRVFASIVPHWMPFGYFWAVLTGIAFVLAGSAICSGILDFPAARLLALMLLLFEGFVEIPPIFIRVHNEGTWGGAVYNVAAIGACWIFADFLASRTERRGIGAAENVTRSRTDPLAA